MSGAHDELLADCLLLCSLPIGSHERGELSRALVNKWSPRVLWGTIQNRPDYFMWWLSVQSARLTEFGKHRLRSRHCADSPRPIPSFTKEKEKDVKH